MMAVIKGSFNHHLVDKIIFIFILFLSLRDLKILNYKFQTDIR